MVKLVAGLQSFSIMPRGCRFFICLHCKHIKNIIVLSSGGQPVLRDLFDLRCSTRSMGFSIPLIAVLLSVPSPSCRAGTYFFEIKKVCKKILPLGYGFLGNAKRKLKKLKQFNFRFGRLRCTKTLTRYAQTHEF